MKQRRSEKVERKGDGEEGRKREGERKRREERKKETTG